MANFLTRLFSNEPSSAKQAKERLQLVLINDRTNLTPETMNSLKDDLLDVISQYIKIDPKSVKIDIAQEGREQRLIADIPITGGEQRRY